MIVVVETSTLLSRQQHFNFWFLWLFQMFSSRNCYIFACYCSKAEMESQLYLFFFLKLEAFRLYHNNTIHKISQKNPANVTNQRI